MTTAPAGTSPSPRSMTSIAGDAPATWKWARQGTTVAVEVTDLSGLAVCGPAAEDVVRAIAAALLVRAGPGGAEVLLTADVAERLFAGLGPDHAVRLAPSADELARAVQAATIARARRFDAAEVTDAASFREANPEDPLPVVLVVLKAVTGAATGLWRALSASAARFGIAVLMLGDSPAAVGRLVTDEGRYVTELDVEPLGEQLAGAFLFGLSRDEAVELLGPVIDVRRDLSTDSDGPSAVPTSLEGDGEALLSPAPSIGQTWPEMTTVVATKDRPLVVKVLGPYHVAAWGEPVSTGLRARAKALLAWYLVRPEGATSEAAVDALWPTTAPGDVQRQFWRALGDLRSRLKRPADEALDVLEKTGEHYRPAAAEFTCDLWEFQRALASAARADDDRGATEALRRAVDAYQGDLLEGSDYTWVEPVRQDLHRRALDAHLRLAELEERAGSVATAQATLERAIDLDRYAEEPYRRLMALHGAQGRLDAVSATWQFLHGRLDELDLEVEPAPPASTTRSSMATPPRRQPPTVPVGRSRWIVMTGDLREPRGRLGAV